MAAPASSSGTDLPGPQAVFPNGEAHEVLPKVFLGSMVSFCEALSAERNDVCICTAKLQDAEFFFHCCCTSPVAPHSVPRPDQMMHLPLGYGTPANVCAGMRL